MYYTIIIALLGILTLEIHASPKTFCPERCTCRKAGVVIDSSSGTDGNLCNLYLVKMIDQIPYVLSGKSFENDADIDSGWIVRCGGTETNKIISIKEIQFGEIEDQIAHL